MFYRHIYYTNPIKLNFVRLQQIKLNHLCSLYLINYVKFSKGNNYIKLKYRKFFNLTSLFNKLIQANK